MPKKPSAARAFVKVQALIIYVAEKFQKDYGGDLDELIAEANFGFVSLYKKYDLSLQKLEHYMRFRIYQFLLDRCRKEQRAKRLFPKRDFEFDLAEAPERDGLRFDRDEFLAKVDRHRRGDAAKVVDTLFSGDYLSYPSPTKARVALQNHLKKRGWTQWRIAHTFEEIRGAVS